MPTLLVRPYAVAPLAEAGTAVRAARDGDLAPLLGLYTTARDLLEDVDPDEVRDAILQHTRAGERDKPAFRAAEDVADTWEGVVALAPSITALPRLRGFLWTCAALRYLDVEPDLDTFKRWCRGQHLPGLSADDTALYAALPALLGLGPDLEEEVAGPCPVEGGPVWRLMGLPDEDWDGLDPLDGTAVSAEACAAAVNTAPPAWCDLLARGADRGGLLVRRG